MTTTTWALAIATYKREDILPICLELAAQQTRPPREIVVVDATPEPDFERMRHRVMTELAPRYPNIKWRYKKACVASAAAQRNQCIDACQSDVLFLIDDDSLMYENCAEKLMRIYDLDVDRAIAGASPIEIAKRPSLDDGSSANTICDTATVQTAAPKKYSPAARWIRRLLSADDIFVPYDDDFPDKPIPAEISALGVGRRRLMAGMTMTVRREYAQAERFSELLARASNGEDSDMSYRVSRHGALVTVFDAHLHHVGSLGGRMKIFQTTAMGALNPLVFHRLHSTDIDRSRQRSRQLLRRRLIIGLIKDVKTRQWTLPQARAIRLAMQHIDRVFGMDESQLRRWYPDYQKQLIEQYG